MKLSTLLSSTQKRSHRFTAWRTRACESHSEKKEEKQTEFLKKFLLKVKQTNVFVFKTEEISQSQGAGEKNKTAKIKIYTKTAFKKGNKT